MYASARDRDTIVALATAHGAAGIAVLRVSGPMALKIARKVLPFLPETAQSHRIYYGFAREAPSGEVIDEVLASYFSHGRSFTGEETVEVSCHGSDTIAEHLQREMIASGCRLADRGEFTYRAFMNGRIDLIQAESILELVESQSQLAARTALRHLKGELSKEIAKIEDLLTWSQANLEANIDFAQEDIVIASNEKLLEKLNLAKEITHRLVSSFATGRRVKDGVRVGFFGPPNVGKSSLLNAVLGHDRAIVTDQPGTTRDVVDGEILREGVWLKFSDTAGFRATNDPIEGIGVKKSRETLSESDVCVWVLDSTGLLTDVDFSEMAGISPDKLVLLWNKCDLDGSGEGELMKKRDLLVQELQRQVQRSSTGTLSDLIQRVEGLDRDRCHAVSAKTGQGLERLLTWIRAQAGSTNEAMSSVVTNGRQFELLARTEKAIDRALGGLAAGQSPEFVAFELQTGVLAIHEILGKRFDDQVMDRVFREFCLGK